MFISFNACGKKKEKGEITAMAESIEQSSSTAGALQLGETTPDFDVPATDGKNIKLSDLRGSWVVLYFYPKAFTSG
jgi:cytochrome oxidase Cu insertion factor (SCO1/SenC/PrrC family)